LGYDGEPFPFDPDRRATLRAELDAYYAKLYGLTRDELRYILDPADVMGEDYPSETFRVLKNKELRSSANTARKGWCWRLGTKYENDDVAQSDAMDRLLRVAAEVPEALAYLAAHAGVEPTEACAAAGGWRPADDWRPEREIHAKSAARVVQFPAPEGAQRRYGT
jgi:hypothetical protein